MGAQVAGRTVDTDAGITSVLPVAVPVGGVVEQYLLLQTEHTVMVFIVHILPPLVTALHGLRPLVGGDSTRPSSNIFLQMCGALQAEGVMTVSKTKPCLSQAVWASYHC